MKLAPYPKYEPSGVEWLGDVPEGWNIRQLKYAASINDETLPETTDPAFEMSYVDIGSVDAIEGIVGVEEMTFESAPSRARRIVRDGDTIVSTVRTYLKAIAYIREPKPNTIVSTGFAVIRPRTINPAFLAYAMRETGFVETIVARSVGVSYPAVNASEIGSLEIPLPSHEEQRAIVDFLDRQTAKIDTLIRKKQALIERLQEKRAALITRTVTRGLPPEAARAAGLDPQPKMKASGVEWLGEVPAHWEVKRLKQVCTLAYGDSLTSESRTDGRYKVYGSNGPVGTHISANTIGPSIIVGRKGSFGKINYSQFATFAIDTTFFIDKRYTNANIRWLYYMLTIIHLDATTKDSAVPGLDRQDAYSREICVCLPDEQRTIADFLDRETAKIDGLIAKVDTAIARLREYRAALITAAVTGQVEVRGEVVVDATATSKHNRKV